MSINRHDWSRYYDGDVNSKEVDLGAGYGFYDLDDDQIHEMEMQRISEIRQAPPAPKPQPQPAPAPAPPPKPQPKPVAKPTGTSDTLQTAYDFKKSGSNFASNTQAERKELTDSFKQKPSYDPQAGIASPEAGNFLDDYKLNLQNKVNKFRTEATNKLNPNPNGGE